LSLTALHIRELKKVKILLDEVKDGTNNFRAEIDAKKINDVDDSDANEGIMSAIGKTKSRLLSAWAASSVGAYLGGELAGIAIVSTPSLLALPMAPLVCGATVVMVGTSYIGAKIGIKIGDLIESDVWAPRA
jgi:hypothetical protein